MNQKIKCIIGSVGNLIPIKTKLSNERARSILQDFSPKPLGRCWGNNKVDIHYDLQIIVPCYNVKKWVKNCLESILNQKTKYKVLVSIVNDGSTDETENIIHEVISQYWNRTDYIVELETQENRGLSGARNSALKVIKGTYVTFLDSDDVLSDGAIDKMLDAAFKYDAEILQGSWYEFTEKSGKLDNHIITKVGFLYDNRGVFSGYPWGKLYKYNVMEHFQFPEGFWFEDTPLSFMLAALPYRCAAIKEVVYGYRLNQEGITAIAWKKKRSVESYWITELCLQEFEKFGVEFDQRAYEYLLHQSVHNQGLVRHHPYSIREAMFVLIADLMEKYFSEFETEVDSLKKIETSLRKKQFVRFDLLTLKR